MHPSLIDLIDRLQTGGSLNPRAIQSDMASIWDALDKEEDRIVLLQVRNLFLDSVERSGALDDEALRTLRGAREGEYRLFLIKEAMIGADTADTAALDRITKREVDAGRMAPDCDLRTLAHAAEAVLGTPPPRKKGWLGGLFG